MLFSNGGYNSEKNECYEGEMPPGLAPRVAVSIVVGVGWLIFLVVFLWFYAADFGISKSLAIFLVSVLVVGGILGPMWAYWGIKTGRAWERKVKWEKKVKKKRARK